MKKNFRRFVLTIYLLPLAVVSHAQVLKGAASGTVTDIYVRFELKNLESVAALQMERQMSTAAIENIGAREMAVKGISNVEEGVKKITGVSVASAGQLIVRGLGDRYSITTLNGLHFLLDSFPLCFHQ